MVLAPTRARAKPDVVRVTSKGVSPEPEVSIGDRSNQNNAAPSRDQDNKKAGSAHALPAS